ncbi:hypothetical protein JR590_002965 [Listeria monocytogenes]|nr:hypothetical protein [Listeria monocytogenes]
MNDLLYESACMFDNLIKSEIIFVLGRKGESLKVKLIFHETDFFHLAGLHKMDDISLIKGKAKGVFEAILQNRLTYKDIENSTKIDSVNERLHIIKSLIDIFSQENNYFKFLKKVIPYSQIKWKYLISFSYNEIDGYIFLEEYRDKKGNFLCRSCFNRGNTAYEQRQIKYTLLQVMMKDEIGEEQELFRSNSYKTDD